MMVPPEIRDRPTREHIHRIVSDLALETLNKGAPGLSAQMRQVLASNIAIKVSHTLCPKAKP